MERFHEPTGLWGHDALAGSQQLTPRNTMERSHGPIGLWGHDGWGSWFTASMGLMDQVASEAIIQTSGSQPGWVSWTNWPLRPWWHKHLVHNQHGSHGPWPLRSWCNRHVATTQHMGLTNPWLPSCDAFHRHPDLRNGHPNCPKETGPRNHEGQTPAFQNKGGGGFSPMKPTHRVSRGLWPQEPQQSTLHGPVASPNFALDGPQANRHGQGANLLATHQLLLSNLFSCGQGVLVNRPHYWWN